MSDPTDIWRFTGHIPAAVQWLFFIAAVLLAGGVVFQFVKKLAVIYNSALHIIDLNPVVLKMASEFRRNSGSSLRDTVDRIERMATEAATSAGTAKELARKAYDRADEVHSIVDKLAALSKQTNP